MTEEQQAVRQVTRISHAEPFRFHCHPGVACFMSCCRELELALTPYDLLRIRKGTGLHSRDVLDRYVIIERDEKDPFPRFYLTMVDDGAASCAFLGQDGCTIYQHRPGACRTYPLGRAAARTAHGIEEQFIVLHEEHCRGFQEPLINTVSSYLESQNLARYHRFNDQLTAILQHDLIKNGMRLNEQQAHLYTLALYDLDSFREHLITDRLGFVQNHLREQLGDDEVLLDFSLQWVERKLFNGQDHSDDDAGRVPAVSGAC